MPSDLTARLGGARSSLAFKAPVRCATTANITPSGFQTIDGITLASGDTNLRILVKDQTNAVDNGIYEMASGAWSRTKDFDGSDDIVNGTRIYVVNGTVNGNAEYVVSTADPITIGTSSISFSGGSVTGAASVTDNAIVRWNGTGGATLQNSVVTIADTTGDIAGVGHIVPLSNDGGALGSASYSFADLFLASGGVVNWNNGDVTATHSANALAFAGASSGYSFDAKLAISGLAANASGLTASGYSLTSSGGDPMVNLAATWNLSAGGSYGPALFRVQLTDTESPPLSRLLDFQVGGGSVLHFRKDGGIVLADPAAATTYVGMKRSGAGIIFFSGPGSAYDEPLFLSYFDGTAGVTSVLRSAASNRFSIEADNALVLQSYIGHFEFEGATSSDTFDVVPYTRASDYGSTMNFTNEGHNAAQRRPPVSMTSRYAGVDILEFWDKTSGSSTLVARVDSGGNMVAPSVQMNGATAASGYGSGAGGAVTQATSRSTGVTLNKPCGAITLVSAAGSTTPATFTVTNSLVAATDTVIVSQKSGSDDYIIAVTAVASGSFDITFYTTGGTTTEQPVFNFAIIKAVAA